MKPATVRAWWAGKSRIGSRDALVLVFPEEVERIDEAIAKDAALAKHRRKATRLPAWMAAPEFADLRELIVHEGGRAALRALVRLNDDGRRGDAGTLIEGMRLAGFSEVRSTFMTVLGDFWGEAAASIREQRAPVDPEPAKVVMPGPWEAEEAEEE